MCTSVQACPIRLRARKVLNGWHTASQHTHLWYNMQHVPLTRHTTCTCLTTRDQVFITNGWHSNVVVVCAKTDTTKGAHGISLFLIEDGMPVRPPALHPSL